MFRKPPAFKLPAPELSGLPQHFKRPTANAANRPMSSNPVVIVIEKPHLTVKLHERVLEVDLTQGLRKELEDLVEAKPALRKTLGFLFQTVIPLDVPLKDIESATLDEASRVKIVIPFRKDMVIPLEPEESGPFVKKLNELVLQEKARAERELQELRRKWQARAPTILSRQ